MAEGHRSHTRYPWAKKDEKMGHLPYRDFTRGAAKVIKAIAARKRRQRNRTLEIL